MKRLRVGIMCGGDRLEAAFAAAVRELTGVDGVELSLLIIDGEPPALGSWRRKLKVTLNGPLWALYQRFFPLRGLPCYRPVDMSREFAGLPRIECRVVRKGKFSQYFRAEDIEQIRAYRLDVILRFAFGIIHGEILEVPTYGVWSYHHGDELKFRGSPPAFWEIYHGEPTTAAILQRLTERLDAGVVLQKCFLRTNRSSYGGNLNALVWASSYMPARVARDILNGCGEYVTSAPSSTNAPIYRAPTDAQMALFALKVAGSWFASRVRGVLYSESWNVGVARAPIHTFLSAERRPDIAWLPFRKSHAFIGGPFIQASGERVRLLMEAFDDFSRYSLIAEAELEDGVLTEPIRPAIDEGVRLSYPYLFEHGGRLYCAPEAYRERGVFLYAFDPDTGRWELEGKLLGDVAAMAPTVLRHDGRWWLFCTDRDDEAESKLLLWSAPDLYGPWTPHPANPVKVDVRSSRPAGTPFVWRGELYRPAQDCSLTYGGGVTINRVTRLTPTEFREQPVARLTPGPASPYPAGMHTLSGSGDWTAVDGRRIVFAPALAVWRVADTLRRAAQRVRRRPSRGEA